MTISTRPFVLLFSMLLPLGGCGGLVVFEADGDGGSTASGGDGGSTSTFGPSTSAGPLPPKCENLCLALADCPEYADDCPAKCAQALYEPSDSCQIEADLFVDCVFGRLDFEGCAPLTSVCHEEYGFLRNCRCNSADNACTTDGTTCSCSGLCGEHAYEATCNADGSACECKRDGVSFGCEAAEPGTNTCAFHATCCSVTPDP